MLIPITTENLPQALSLLKEGFPDRPHNYWESTLDRMRAFGANEAVGVAFGLLLIDKKTNSPAGVCLTLASSRQELAGGQTAMLNPSAMYVRPDQRWLAPLMLRTISRMNADTILDLTPSDPVQKMLPAMGFRPFCSGISIVPTMLAALTKWSSAKVLPISAAPRDKIPEWEKTLLESHTPFNCLAATLRADGAYLPLLFKLDRKVKGLPSATLLYSTDNAQLYKHIGAVSRFLATRGVMALRLDTMLDTKVPGFARTGQAVKFAKGSLAANRTDYAGTELALFEI